MKRSVFLFLIVFNFMSVALAQQIEVLNRSDFLYVKPLNYESAIHVGDSLFSVYQKTPFKISVERESGNGYQDGVDYIIHIYETALKYKPQDQYAIVKLSELYELNKKQQLDRLKVHFDQLMEKGDHYFSLKEFDKAEQLYKAAHKVFSTDSLCNEKLKILSSRPKN